MCVIAPMPSIAFSAVTDWPRLLTDVIVAYRWFAMVLLVILVFRRPIKDFIDRLKNITAKWGEKEVSLSAGKTTAPPIAGHIALPTRSDEEFKELLSGMRKKLLATLWHYQKGFGDDISKRWTFILGIGHPEHKDFVSAIQELAALGLVDQAPDSGQFYLTNAGLHWCSAWEQQLRDSTKFELGST